MKISNVLSFMNLTYALRGDRVINEPVDVSLLDLDLIDGELTQELFDASVEAYSKYLEETSYKLKRAEEYPSITDQLDMIYHDHVNGTKTWISSIEAVKNKYPKPQQ